MTGMNRRGRGAPGRHWKYGERPVERTSVSMHPEQYHRLRKRARGRPGGFSEAVMSDLELAAQARQFAGPGRSLSELERQRENEARELKKTVSRIGGVVDDQDVLIQELTELLRRRGVRLSKRDMEGMVRRRRERDELHAAHLITQRRPDLPSPPPPSSMDGDLAPSA